MRFAQKYKISTNRLANWDYSTPADYFINICTYNHNNFFGKIIDNKMELSPRGIIAQNCLINIPIHFSDVCLDAYVVMPDLASLQDNRQIKMVTHDHLNHPDFYSTINQKSKQLIPNIVQQYKSTVTRLINPKIIFFAWQSRYHDMLIKNAKQFSIIKNYIISNPTNWQKDKYFLLHAHQNY